jgi:hypothetical protein
MKQLLVLLAISLISGISYSQTDTTSIVDTNTYRILKTDGQELIGQIISQDAREILLKTSDNREFYVPQHVIEKIELLDRTDFNNKGDFVGEDKFATRYFITTNGLPIKKGEHYIQWNLFGPDFQFGLGNNFGVGIMTSWFGTPVIGTVKKSWEIGEKTQIAVGGLIGTGTWIAPEWGGALPFATLSFGSRKSNIAISGGYGAVWFGNGAQGRAIASVAGMIKIAPRVSLVFDSFILLPKPSETFTDTYTQQVYNSTTGEWENQEMEYTYTRKYSAFAMLIPGVRWHTSPKSAFQFGFSGVYADNDIVPVPIPMIQWYRSLK